MRRRSPAARTAMVALLVLTGLGLSSCMDDHPGRNHPHDRHGGHDRHDTPHYR